MATVTRTINKTAFVTRFLGKNPGATSTAASKAWAAAGNSGTISPSLVSNLRAKMGLIGAAGTGSTAGRSPRTAVRRTKAGARVQVKTRVGSARSKPGPARAPATRRQGKSTFIKELLVDNPTATTAVVNRAWKAAGMKGTISKSLVSKTRSKLDLAGNLIKKPAATSTAAAMARRGDRDRLLAEIEREIDRLIFRLLAIGGMEKAEAALRSARRAVVRGQTT